MRSAKKKPLPNKRIRPILRLPRYNYLFEGVFLGVELGKAIKTMDKWGAKNKPPTAQEVKTFGRQLNATKAKLDEFFVYTLTHERKIGKGEAEFLRHRLKDKLNTLFLAAGNVRFKHKSIPTAKLLGELSPKPAK